MFIRKDKRPVFVTLPDGTRMSRADLPAVTTTRWVARRKMAVVQAVTAGLITAEEACAMYSLSLEELDEWTQALARHGPQALRVTSLQRYRQS